MSVTIKKQLAFLVIVSRLAKMWNHGKKALFKEEDGKIAIWIEDSFGEKIYELIIENDGKITEKIGKVIQQIYYYEDVFSGKAREFLELLAKEKEKYRKK